MIKRSLLARLQISAKTTELILQLGLENEVDLLSSGGGAMLAFLAGEKLPALETLGLQNE